MTSPGVHLRFRKPNGSEHWAIPVQPFVDDDFGRWFKAAAGWEISRPGRNMVVDNPSVWLLPSRGDYLARFNGPRPDGSPPRSEVYVDICLYRRTQGDDLWFTDLDLDVARRPGGRVELLDEDELLANIVTFGYSMDLVRAAISSSEAVVGAVALGREPFGEVGPTRLREAFGPRSP